MSHAHAPQELTKADVTLPEGHFLHRVPVPAFLAGLAALVLAVLWSAVAGDGVRFYYAYLTAFLFWLSIGLGGLFFVILQHAVRAGWSVAVRRLAENMAGTLRWSWVLFLPIAFGGMYRLFHWTHDDAVSDAILRGKASYLNTGFFMVRAAAYLAIWAGLAHFFVGRSVAQDDSGDADLSARMRRWSPLGIAAYALSISFAAFDWSMSLDPHWYSTMYGVQAFSGQVVACMATMILLRHGLEWTGGFKKPVITPEHDYDLGKLLFAFVVFWAYISFSQFMLYWYANIPEETIWYRHRLENGWLGVSLLLMIGHFALPFLFLMPRTVKKIPKAMFAAAAWMLVMHYVDVYWYVMPNMQHDGAHAHFAPGLADLLCFAGVGGIFVGLLARQFVGRALVPLRDPRIVESLTFENA